MRGDDDAELLGSRMCCALPVGIVAGVAVGVGIAGAQLAGLQLVVSVAAAVLLALSNFVDERVRDQRALSLTCVALGAFLGYGLGSVCQAFGIIGGGGGGGGGDDTVASLHLPLFLVLVTLFHLAEFTFTVWWHPANLEFRAFLLAPVPMGGYSIAMVAALVEFWLEEALFGWHTLLPASIRAGALGMSFALAFGGWALRTAALFTARSNFTHLISYEKKSSHALVTHGVYRCSRHPGYVGWFFWSVCSQLVLFNPCCLMAYAYVSWRFFASRIPDEEAYLVRFFGEEYLEYARRVPCGIPGISALG